MKEFQELIDEIMDFQKKTFPTSTSISKLYHLEKEIPELIDELAKVYHNSGDNKVIEMEYADAFLLLIGSAANYGLTADHIASAIRQKIEINKKRNWGNPDKNGVVQHLK